MAGNGSLLYNVADFKKPDWTPTRSELRDPAEIAASLGITYGMENIQGIFDQATQAQFASQQKAQQASENKFYNDMFNTQHTAMDTIRRSNAESIATGASRGLQAANELSAVLGLQQESVAGATDLALQRATLADEEMAAYAANARDAMTAANAAGAQLGSIQGQLYSADTQFDVGQMDYYATLDASIKQLMGAQEQASATRYNADQNAAAQRYAADRQYAAAMDSAKLAAKSSGGGYSSAKTERLGDELNHYIKTGNYAGYMATMKANNVSDVQATTSWVSATKPSLREVLQGYSFGGGPNFNKKPLKTSSGSWNMGK